MCFFMKGFNRCYITVIGLFLICLGGIADNVSAGEERGISVIRKTANQFGFVDYNPQRFHALIIGIDKYENLQNLETAVQDAKAVAETLQELYGFGQIYLLLDKQATRRNILHKLQTLRDTLTPKDSLLIYYAGHGRFDKNGKVGSWIPTDGDFSDNYDDVMNSAIVNDYLNKLKVRHLLLLSDSCFSGSLTRGNSIQYKETSVLKRFQKPSRYVLTSGDLQPVPDDAGNGHSPFCNRMLQYLQASDSPIFDVQDLFMHMRDSLPSTPILAPLNTSAHDPGGMFVFIRKTKNNSEIEQLSKQIAQIVESKPTSPLIGKKKMVTTENQTFIMGNTNLFSITNPSAGMLTIGDKSYDLANSVELALSVGVYPFTLKIPGNKRLVYGLFEVLVVDDDTSVALFGVEDPLFKESHVKAALRGSPVSYSIGLSNKGRKKIVANYRLSLRKIN